MSESRRIVFLVYPGFELLDVSGPAAVFTGANELRDQTLYRVSTASVAGGAIESSSGIAVETVQTSSLRFRENDTILVAGALAPALANAIRDKALVRTVRRAEERVERLGSVCSGSFILGASGMLVDRRATTHWSGVNRMRAMFPETHVEGDALYVEDGNVWTSAGVASGIDLGLAMLERDHGARLKSRIARHLVVYSHRPGYQSQFSEMLAAQGASDEKFVGLVGWLMERIGQRTKVADMAAYVGLSERTFYRQFVEAFGRTPSRFFESLRLESGRGRIEAGEPVKVVAGKIGFRSESAFRSAFKEHFGVPPSHHARAHSEAPSKSVGRVR